jgi:hypothetical protein
MADLETYDPLLRRGNVDGDIRHARQFPHQIVAIVVAEDILARLVEVGAEGVVARWLDGAIVDYVVGHVVRRVGHSTPGLSADSRGSFENPVTAPRCSKRITGMPFESATLIRAANSRHDG